MEESCIVPIFQVGNSSSVASDSTQSEICPLQRKTQMSEINLSVYCNYLRMGRTIFQSLS